jgi:hypothetical protein
MVKQEDDKMNEDEDEDGKTMELGSPGLTKKPSCPIPSFDYHYPAALTILNPGVTDTFCKEIIEWMLNVHPLPVPIIPNVDLTLN